VNSNFEETSSPFALKVKWKTALYTIVRALKPGGELVLACSNPASPKGIVSKLTPHRFHRFVYKRGWFGYTFVDDPAYHPSRPTCAGRFSPAP
jgi:hypothetical protein